MKKLFLVATVALGLLVSCNKEENEIRATSKGAVVTVSFTDEEPTTHAFFGETTAAEAWEKTLNTVTMFVFDPSGDMLVKRQFSAIELSDKKATFALPNATPGDVCEFYAVANFDVTAIDNRDKLIALIECNPGPYKGMFSEVTTKAMRTGGFVMSGKTSQTVAAAGSITNVSVTLKRTVAKVAFQTTPSPLFGTLYQEIVRINSITISHTASQTFVYEASFTNTGGMGHALHQGSKAEEGTYRNLFYIYENEAFPAGSRVKATLDATYDRDGNFSTWDDQSAITYELELDGAAGGEIRRNGYYRVDVTFNGLTGQDATLTITPAEWESPVTQTVELGA